MQGKLLTGPLFPFLFRISLSAAVLISGAPALLFPAVPRLMNLQGRLTDKSGIPLTGIYEVKFSVWDSAVGGGMLWNETQNVTCARGIFQILLGSVNPIPSNVFSDGEHRYLEIDIENPVNDPPMTPRQRLVTVAYAFLAEEAVHSRTADEAARAQTALTAQSAQTAQTSVLALSVPDGIITNPKLAPQSVTSQKISDLAVTESKLADRAVTPQKLSLDAIYTDEKAVNATSVSGKFLQVSAEPETAGQLILPGTSPVISASIPDGKITLTNDTKVEGQLVVVSTLTIGTNSVKIGGNVYDGYTISVSGGDGSFTGTNDITIQSGLGSCLYLNPSSGLASEVFISNTNTLLTSIGSQALCLYYPTATIYGTNSLDIRSGIGHNLNINTVSNSGNTNIGRANSLTTIGGSVKMAGNDIQDSIGTSRISFSPTINQINFTGKLVGDGSGITNVNAATLNTLASSQFLRSDTGAVVYSTHIANIAPSKILPGNLASNVIVSSVSAGAVGSGQIADGAVTPAKIQQGSTYNIVAATAIYSTNSDTLDGYDSSYFLNVSGSTQTKTGSLVVLGNVNASKFTGDGSGLTNLPTAQAFVADAQTLSGRTYEHFLTTSSLTQTKSGGLNLATQSGNVGIGTASPNIAGVTASQVLTINSGSQSALEIAGFGPNPFGLLAFTNTANNKVLGQISAQYQGTPDNGSMSFWTADNQVLYPRMAINRFGNVGIGTTDPASRLEVNVAGYSDGAPFQIWKAGSGTGSQDYSLTLKQVVTPGIIRWAFDQKNAGVNYNNVLTMKQGNVGIGTANPSEQLDVAGGIKSKGNIVPRCNSGVVTLNAWGDSDWIDSGLGDVPIFVYAEDIYTGITGVSTGARGYTVHIEIGWGSQQAYLLCETTSGGRFRILSHNWGLANSAIRWWTFTIF